MKKRRIWGLFLVLIMLLLRAGGAFESIAPVKAQAKQSYIWQQFWDDEDDWEDAYESESETAGEDDNSGKLPVYGEYYYDLTNVVLYLVAYDELPDNFITKKEARKLGWQGGSVEDYLEGAAIGGDVFGNREGLLPEAKGRTYTECDIDTDGYSSRGARRLVFSDDGLYFYTLDHYETFSEVTVTDDYEVIW